ncbi:Protein phosphatase 2C homolog 2 Short=PP2C-2 [Serendipita indica DSM 11827]|nr:Protein phosphatase 2C homolog 2 Short=PP2C-2 [Serendipita indica DSM 11827]
MGQTLSEPVTEKHSESGADDRYAYAISEMQGWRVSMEDAHTTLLKLDPSSGNSFFAVFDGHGGSTVAKYAGQHVAERLAQESAYIEGDYATALKKAFLGTDDDLRADTTFMHDPSGCTAVAALLTKDRKLYVANAGDSRSVLSIKGEVKPMSFDHKPTNKDETARIVAAGGFVEYGRVNGNLALSRAIGDFEFKSNNSLGPEKQIVTANPDIEIHELSDEDEFLILACDGIWDCLSSQQAVDMVRRLIAQKKSLQEICETTIQRCCAPDADTGAGVGCDDMTMIVVAILNGRTIDQWYDWIAERVEKNYGYATGGSPQIFAESRILAAQNRSQYRSNAASAPALYTARPAGFGALARIMAGGTGISFAPAGRGGGSNILSFSHDDDDDDYEDDDDDDAGDTGEGGLFGVNRLKVGGDGKDKTNSLKSQLSDLESGLHDDEMDHDGGAKITAVDEDEEMTDSLPRAHITLASPSEKQGMIDLGVVQVDKSSETPSETGFANDGKSWVKVSSPAHSEISSIGSPLVPLPSLAIGKAPAGAEASKRQETPPPPVPAPSAAIPNKVPPQDTGRVPDADAHPGLTNHLLDKNEDTIKA